MTSEPFMARDDGTSPTRARHGASPERVGPRARRAEAVTPEITREDRERLRALEREATPGPWLTKTGKVNVGVVFAKDSAGTTWHVASTVDSWNRHVENAEYIAAARNALIPLLDALDRAEAERDAALADVARLRVEVERWRKAVTAAVPLLSADGMDYDGAMRLLLPLIGQRRAVWGVLDDPNVKSVPIRDVARGPDREFKAPGEDADHGK